MLACLLAFLVCFAYLFWFALLGWLARLARLNTRNLTKRRLRRRLVEFLVFNLLALVFLELARRVRFPRLHACFTLVWFVWSGSLFCFYLLCCTLLACFALTSLLGLLCLLCLLCDAWLSRFHMTRFGLYPLDLIWLGRLASWHALELEYIYIYINTYTYI